MKKLALIAAVVMLFGGMAVSGTFANDFDPIFKPLTQLVASWDNEFLKPEAGLNVELVYQVREGNTLVERNNNLFAQASYDDDDFPADSKVKISLTAQGSSNSHNYWLWNEDHIQGAIDKFVSVKNLSNQPVYYCIAIAVSQPETVMHLNLNTVDFTWLASRKIQIQDESQPIKTYTMHLAISDNDLAAGAVSPAALLQVALDKDVTTLPNGADIRVKVMAVETAGFSQLTYDNAKDDNTNKSVAYNALNAALQFEIDSFNPFPGAVTNGSETD